MGKVGLNPLLSLLTPMSYVFFGPKKGRSGFSEIFWEGRQAVRNNDDSPPPVIVSRGPGDLSRFRDLAGAAGDLWPLRDMAGKSCVVPKCFLPSVGFSLG